MQGSPTHDAEWQPTRDFVDRDRTINEKLSNYIGSHCILQELWNEQDTEVFVDENKGGGE